MNFACAFAAIGLLAIAGVLGVLFGWLEKKANEELNKREKEKRHA